MNKLDTRLSYAIVGIAALAIGIIIGVSGAKPSSPPPATPLPTQNLDAVRTEAVSTFAAEITGTASAVPSATITETETPPADSTGAAATDSTGGPATASTGGPSATPTCLGLRWIRDVTIPDNTGMTPAEVFTKSWLVENSGTCPWQSGFQVVLIGGVAMGGSPFQLAQQVGPGGRIQVSIKMVAPTNQTGIVQGTWKMADSTGKPFGDYMSVVIVVGTGSAPAPALPTARATATP